MRPKVCVILRACIFFSGLAAWVVAVVLVFRGELLWATFYGAVALSADTTGRVWSHKSPVPMPYFMRWALLVPRGPHSPKHLKQILQPQSGERILEIGPGIGVHALPVAISLVPDGVLEVLDIQREMLVDLARRAGRKGLANIVPTQGDAQKLPYADRAFDAAYLIGVLGEIPDAVATLRELRRVLKPRSRLVISELLIDPDFISLRMLREKAGDADFVFERSSGPRWAYSALFRPASALPYGVAESGPRRIEILSNGNVPGVSHEYRKNLGFRQLAKLTKRTCISRVSRHRGLFPLGRTQGASSGNFALCLAAALPTHAPISWRS